MKKNFFHSILVRYMISYAAIMAVLFLGVGLYMNNSYASMVRTNTIEHNINRMSTLRMQHEEKLNTLVMIGSQISVSYYISPFRLEDEPMNAYHLKQQLAPYAVTSDFSDHIFLIFNMDEYVYSSATTMSLDLFVEKLILYEHTSPEVLRALLRRTDNRMSILPAQGLHSILTEGSQREMVTVFVPLLMGERYNTGNVMFLIDDIKYQRMFAEEIYGARSTMILYGEEVLTASRGLPLDDALILDTVRQLDGSTICDFSVDGRDYLMVALRGTQHDMTYLTIIPHETLRASMAYAQVGFMVFLFALSIPCILLTFYLARRQVKPIRELRRLFDATPAITNDFEAIQSGIAGLFDQNEQLQTHIAHSIPAQKGSFVSWFVKGLFPSRTDVMRRAAALGMDIDKAYYMIALMAEPRDQDQLLDIDQIIAYGGSSVTGYGVQLATLEQYLFVLFANSCDALERCVWQAKTECLPPRGSLTIACSNIHQAFDQAATAYLEASAAYDNRFIMGNNNVLRFSDINEAAKGSASFAKAYLEGFRKAVRTKDERALGDRIAELFQYLRNTGLSLFTFRIIYNNIIGMLLGEHLSQENSELNAMEYYDVFTLSSCQSIDDLDDILRKLCHDILSEKESAPVQVQPLIRDIIVHMHEQYTDPGLSMNAIADTYGISAVRLSLNFKEITGMNPSEYLLMLRIEKAKELLLTTDTSVKEIGSMVGYYDASGFIRRFKRSTSMTPAQYRKNVSQNVKTEKEAENPQ